MNDEDPKTMTDTQIQKRLDELEGRRSTWGEMGTTSSERETLRAEQIRRREPAVFEPPPLPKVTRDRAIEQAMIRVNEARESLQDALFFLVQGKVHVADLHDAFGLLEKGQRALQEKAPEKDGRTLRYLNVHEHGVLRTWASNALRSFASPQGRIIERLMAEGLMTSDRKLTPEGQEALRTWTYWARSE